MSGDRAVTSEPQLGVPREERVATVEVLEEWREGGNGRVGMLEHKEGSGKELVGLVGGEKELNGVLVLGDGKTLHRPPYVIQAVVVWGTEFRKAEELVETD